MIRRYRAGDEPLVHQSILIAAMDYDWQRGAFDEAVATSDAWLSEGIGPGLSFEILPRILRQRAFAVAAGIEPPIAGWLTAWQIEALGLEGREGYYAVAWDTGCPGLSPPAAQTLVAIYGPKLGSIKLHLVGKTVTAGAFFAQTYPVREDSFFDAVAFPDSAGVKRSYLVTRVWSNPFRHGRPWQIQLFSLDDDGLRPVEMEGQRILQDFTDIAHDGRYEAISFDPQWDQWCSTATVADAGTEGLKGSFICAGNTRQVPVVLAIDDGRLVDACRDFPEYFDEFRAEWRWRRSLAVPIKEPLEMQFHERLGDFFVQFAARMQQGRIEEALDGFDRAVETAGFAEDEGARARKVAGYLRTEVEGQRAALDRPCPMSGLVLE